MPRTKKPRTKKTVVPKGQQAWSIYGGPDGKTWVGDVLTPVGETPVLHGDNGDPLDMGVMFEPHRSPPVLRGVRETKPDLRDVNTGLTPEQAGLIRTYSALEGLADTFRGVRGLEPRDVFALAALMGDSINRSPEDMAKRSYLVADAMMKERSRSTEVSYLADGSPIGI